MGLIDSFDIKYPRTKRQYPFKFAIFPVFFMYMYIGTCIL